MAWNYRLVSTERGLVVAEVFYAASGTPWAYAIVDRDDPERRAAISSVIRENLGTLHESDFREPRAIPVEAS